MPNAQGPGLCSTSVDKKDDHVCSMLVHVVCCNLIGVFFRYLVALMVLFAPVDDVPPPSAAAPMEGLLLLSSGHHARGLRFLLVLSCRGSRLNGSLLCRACLVGSR